MNAAGFWDDQEKAGVVLQEAKALRAIVQPWDKTHKGVKDALEMYELAEMENETALFDQLAETADGLEGQVGDLDTKNLLGEPYDHCSVYFSIHAGAGGTESCDWALMLLRMYERFFERNDYEATTLSLLPGEEAGIRHVTLRVVGEFAYGYLKAEIGVHRLVRISPFDSNKRRHTSFCSVDCTPEIEDTVEIEIRDKDLRVDTYRASGAGGQHVNKTDSAVRLTHLPSGLVAQCQTERSQISNKVTAMKMLKAKLWQLAEMKREEELARLSGNKASISWGSQIRSYVLQPYQLIKDTRTGVEIGNVQAVLDGEIMPFIKEYLQWRAKNS